MVINDKSIYWNSTLYLEEHMIMVNQLLAQSFANHALCDDSFREANRFIYHQLQLIDYVQTTIMYFLEKYIDCGNIAFLIDSPYEYIPMALSPHLHFN